MDDRAVAYVEEVLRHVHADERTKARLAEDLTAHIEAAAEQVDMETVLRRMGPPADKAREFAEAFDANENPEVAALRRENAYLRQRIGYEYKSKARLFGLPLVHVNMSSGRVRFPGGGHPRLAKGIIAIGDMSIGVISIGGLAAGGICLGGLSVGLVSLGGVALGLLLGVGGLTTGMFAMGGCAVGAYAFGGAAFAERIAIGGYARGMVAVGGEAVGRHAISLGSDELDFALVSAAQVRELIRAAYPNLSEWIVRLFSGMFS